MLLFATSDKGGTGRSVSSCNLAYRRALQGANVCYVDFDFGSPTAGAIFGIDDLEHGTYGNGVHEYLQDLASEPERHSVWAVTPPDGASTVVSNIDAESLNLSSLVILWLDNSYKIQTKLL